jgi:hypothetical protein
MAADEQCSDDQLLCHQAKVNVGTANEKQDSLSPG